MIISRFYEIFKLSRYGTLITLVKIEKTVIPKETSGNGRILKTQILMIIQQHMNYLINYHLPARQGCRHCPSIYFRVATT